MFKMDNEVELLKGMVSIYSPTEDEEGIARMRDFLVYQGKALGLDANVDDVGNVLLTTGNGSKHIMFLCHMDTVPGELKVFLDGPILHGRGSVDAKGCLAAAIMAAAAFKGTSKGKVTVIAVPDEEGASNGVREIIKGPRPDLVIVGEPSGWEGITIGYKGALRLRYEGRTDVLHAGMRQQNSAEMAVEFWGAIEAYCIQMSEEAGGEGLFEVLSPTLISINTQKDGRSMTTCMEIDVRIPPGHGQDGLMSFMELNRAGAKVEVVGSEPPVLALKNNELVKALIWAIRAQEGDPKFKKKTGTSDMNVAAEAWEDIPIVAYGPGESSLDHSPEERTDIREYRRTIEILKQTIGRLFEK
jgi:LysW-gamma-L-lysine carboxypeptidase